jgi:hypothetical protein
VVHEAGHSLRAVDQILGNGGRLDEDGGGMRKGSDEMN